MRKNILLWSCSAVVLGLMGLTRAALAETTEFSTHETMASGATSLRWYPNGEPLKTQATGLQPNVQLSEVGAKHLQKLAQSFNWSQAMRDSLVLTHIHDLGHGPILLRYEQQVDGLSVYAHKVALLLDRKTLALTAVSGSPAIVEGRRQALPEQKGDSESIHEAIASALGISGAHWKAQPNGPPGATAWAVTAPTPINKSGLYRVTVHPRWLALNGVLEAGIVVETDGPSRTDESGDHQALLLSLGRKPADALISATSRIQDFAFDYRAYADAAGPWPTRFGRVAQPHPTGTPTPSLSFPDQSALLTSFDHASFLPTADDWLPATATDTNGNNADVFLKMPIVEDDHYGWYEDTGTFSPATGDFRATTTGPQAFDYIQDVSRGIYYPRPGDPVVSNPSDNDSLNANLVDVFVQTNWLHDLYYKHGFTETAGNFQRDNYGRGGFGGDAMRVVANYGTFVNSSIFDGGDSFISWDADHYDLSVLAHEWTHAVYGRLRGYQQSSRTNQSVALNEGWADFMGMLTIFNNNALTEDPMLLGAYALGPQFELRPITYFSFYGPQPIGYQYDPWYFGIRRFPYTRDFAKNPLTFRHIAYHEPVPSTPAYFSWKGRGPHNSEGHSAGEIWANALWGCFTGLVPVHGADAARDRMFDYAIASMHLEPRDVTFLEARDSLLAVMRTGDETDYLKCRAAFAARGMGAGSVSPARYSMELDDVVENFSDSDAALRVVATEWSDGPTSFDHDGILDVGETATASLTVMNTGFEPITDAELVLSSPEHELVFPAGRILAVPTLAPGETTTLQASMTLTTGPAPRAFRPVTLETLLLSRTFAFELPQEFAAITHYDRVPRATTLSDLESPLQGDDWTAVQTSYNPASYYFSDPCWHWIDNAGNGEFVVDDAYGGFSCRLTSPKIVASATEDLVLRFDHSYRFTYGLTRFTGVSSTNLPRGGGRIEISIDGGPWQDIKEFVPGFEWPGTVSGSRHFNGLTGSAVDYPRLMPMRFSLGRLFAGHIVQFGFFADLAYTHFPANDAAWIIDNVRIEGTREPAFSAVGAD